MAGQIHLNAFTQCSPSHQFKGMWRHPEDQTATGYRDLDYWVELARTCERGLFDAIFFADVHGTYDTYGGNERAGLRYAVQTPGIDPTLIISALAGATSHLGFAVTYSTTYHSPYQTAKVFSSLDHLTGGRIGWNIVTSYLTSAYENGLGEQLAHDERYDRAEEYLEVVYALWERSWEENAVVLDATNDVFSDPDRVHRIDHDGTWFRVRGPHQVEPSVQRTPVLYQAGASARGTRFGARHGEVIFIAQQDPAAARRQVDQLRRQAEVFGRDPDSLTILLGVRIMVAENDDAARDRLDQFARFASPEGMLALWGGWTGIDLGSIDPAMPLRDLQVAGMQTMVDQFFAREPDREWTLGDARATVAETANRCRIWGGPVSVADQLEEWMETGIDGFNLITTPHPTGFELIVDHLVPELQRRGRYRTSYGERTLRERYSGRGPRLSPPHPAVAAPSPPPESAQSAEQFGTSP